MLLTVFDIDGTLCRTSGIDDSCWIRTARELFGVEKLSTDWSDYPHSTDESIAATLLGDHLRAEPTREDLDRVRDHFVELVRRTHRQDPATIQPTPGAVALLGHLRRQGHAVSIATGGWTGSATIKLEHSGFDWRGIPAAFACDARPREEIIATSMQRSAEAHDRPVDSFAGAVYFGDGSWDLAASRCLGVGFIGVAEGPRAERLREGGARFVVPDLRDHSGILSILNRHGSDPDSFFRPVG